MSGIRTSHFGEELILHLFITPVPLGKVQTKWDVQFVSFTELHFQ